MVPPRVSRPIGAPAKISRHCCRMDSPSLGVTSPCQLPRRISLRPRRRASPPASIGAPGANGRRRKASGPSRIQAGPSRSKKTGLDFLGFLRPIRGFSMSYAQSKSKCHFYGASRGGEAIALVLDLVGSRFGGHTISGCVFNVFKPLPRHFRAATLDRQPVPNRDLGRRAEVQTIDGRHCPRRPRHASHPTLRLAGSEWLGWAERRLRRNRTGRRSPQGRRRENKSSTFLHHWQEIVSWAAGSCCPLFPLPRSICVPRPTANLRGESRHVSMRRLS